MTQLMRKKQAGNLAKLPVASDKGASQCQQLQAAILDVIPLARAMQLQVIKIDQNSGLHLYAPLEPNSNDTGNAFGGAIGCILMLAGWGWVQLANASVGFSKQVVIQHTDGHCELPCGDDLNVICPAPYESDWQRYCHIYQKRGRARLRLQPLLLKADGSVASSMVAEYVATDSSFNNTTT